MSDWELPERGVVFWPVGKADSTTVVVDPATVIQVDIYQPGDAANDDDDRVPIVDRLADVLPRADDGVTPRMAVLAITHHDTDHCTGFDRLCDEFQIEEMWLTLRSFVEDKNKEQLTGPGQQVYDEAKRRRDAEIAALPYRAAAGDRLRIIGREELLEDADWTNFPVELVTRAGNHIPEINGVDLSELVEVFIHTPFREPDGDDDRNSSSLGMRITLKDGDCERHFMLLGDLDHEKIDAFVDKSEERGNDEYLWWVALLAPHHGSCNAIMRKDDSEAWVKAEAYFDLERYKLEDAIVIISSRSLDSVGANDTDPPHKEAIACYAELVGKDNVYITADYAKGNDSEPIVVEVSSDAWGDVRESKAAFKARMNSMAAISGASTIRPGDSQGATGDQEYS